MPVLIDRRLLVLGLPVALAGCVSAGPPPAYVDPGPAFGSLNPMAYDMYGPIEDERFPVPAVDISRIDPVYLRQVVAFEGREPPGSVVVDPSQRFLYHVGENGEAVRYGVGVGREGFGWHGTAAIRRKAEWPTWTPPREMILRQPELTQYASGMPGGLDNPLGARAMYLYQGDRDTLYRIHGTNEPDTIGTQVSSGCIRMINQDVIDLYRRVPTGTRVVVRSSEVA